MLKLDQKIAAVFFDRDGVLIEDGHYLSDPDDMIWISGARELLIALAAAGTKSFIVTNQSGVARGYFDLSAVTAIHARMIADLGSSNIITDIAVCPHHPEGVVAEFTGDCACRKPAPGMILQLLEKHALQPSKCCLVGDKPRDVQAAKAAGVAGYLFSGGDLKDWFERTLLQEEGATLGT